MNLQSADSVSYFCPDKTTVLSADILAVFIKIRDETLIFGQILHFLWEFSMKAYAEKKPGMTGSERKR